MKLLSGADIAEYMKERQARDARRLLQNGGVAPKLVIIRASDNPVIDIYLRLKQAYGQDVGVEVEVCDTTAEDIKDAIEKFNADTKTHGIIVQLPLPESLDVEEIVNLVSPTKDVDGLAATTNFDPATPLAILWILAGYNIDLRGKKVVLVGRGKLVGAPLERLLVASGIEPIVLDDTVQDLKAELIDADVIVTATGHPGLIDASMLKKDVVVIDAGVAVEGGVTKGDLNPNVYDLKDIKVTPTRGGVGPLTVTALFENVLKAAQQSATTE